MKWQYWLYLFVKFLSNLNYVNKIINFNQRKIHCHKIYKNAFLKNLSQMQKDLYIIIIINITLNKNNNASIVIKGLQLQKFSMSLPSLFNIPFFNDIMNKIINFWNIIIIITNLEYSFKCRFKVITNKPSKIIDAINLRKFLQSNFINQ